MSRFRQAPCCVMHSSSENAQSDRAQHLRRCPVLRCCQGVKRRKASARCLETPLASHVEAGRSRRGGAAQASSAPITPLSSMSTTTPDSSTQRNDLDSKNQPCASEKPPPPSSSSSSSGEDGDGDYHEASEGAAPAPAAGVKAEEASPRERSEDASHLLVCRICFEGRDSEGEGLGKLIAPCRCRGTMKVSQPRCHAFSLS